MLESIANGGSFLEGFEDGALSGAISGAIGGAAFAGLGQLGAVAGKGIKCMSGFGKFIKGTASVTKVMSTAMGGFDTIALVDKAFGNGDIATLNAKLHESKAYNIFQTGVTATAVFTGGMTTTMKCFVAGTIREMIALFGTPVLARWGGRLVPISVAGINSMDVCLPMIVRSSYKGEELIPIAILHGIALEVSVPFLINAFC